MTDPTGSPAFAGLEIGFARSASTAALARALADHADVEGCPTVAIELRALAGRETGFANGLVDFMVETPGGFADSAAMVAHFVSDVLPASVEMFTTLAGEAREDGLDEVADWMDRMAAAQHDHSRALLGSQTPPRHGETLGDTSADRSKAADRSAHTDIAGSARPALRSDGGAR